MRLNEGGRADFRCTVRDWGVVELELEEAGLRRAWEGGNLGRIYYVLLALEEQVKKAEGAKDEV